MGSNLSRVFGTESREQLVNSEENPQSLNNEEEEGDFSFAAPCSACIVEKRGNFEPPPSDFDSESYLTDVTISHHQQNNYSTKPNASSDTYDEDESQVPLSSGPDKNYYGSCDENMSMNSYDSSPKQLSNFPLETSFEISSDEDDNSDNFDDNFEDSQNTEDSPLLSHYLAQSTKHIGKFNFLGKNPPPSSLNCFQGGSTRNGSFTSFSNDDENRDLDFANESFDENEDLNGNNEDGPPVLHPEGLLNSADLSRNEVDEIEEEMRKDEVIEKKMKKLNNDEEYMAIERKRFVLPPHIITHQTPCGELYECEKCSSTFGTKYNGKYHEFCGQNGLKKPFICNIDKCGKEFISRYHFDYHRTTKHTLKPRYSCEVCKKGFVQKSKLKTHLYVHSGEKPFKCRKCSNEYRTGEQLRHHIEKVHSNTSKQYICSQCGKQLCTSKSLKRHMLTIHLRKGAKEESTQVFKCEVCSIEYKSEQRLKNHSRIHNKETRAFRSYHCMIEDCNTTFNNLSSYQRHKMAHKNGRQFFTCPECPNQKYTRIDNLTRHMKTHYPQTNASIKNTPEQDEPEKNEEMEGVVDFDPATEELNITTIP